MERPKHVVDVDTLDVDVDTLDILTNIVVMTAIVYT